MSKAAEIKQQQYETIIANHTFVTFRGTTLTLTPASTYIPLTATHFAQIVYQHFPYALISQIRELEHLIRATAPPAPTPHLIAFPNSTEAWDTLTASVVPAPDTPPPLATTLSPAPTHAHLARAYLDTLSAGDPALAADYLQAIAPLFLHTKPTGIVWFVGGGANGKSALINAIYRLIGPHLTSLTVADIEDGRDTPRLNGVIGNVCRESSESRVEDTERYKALGTHETFQVHKFHSQEAISIDGNIHTIFNANNIPVFSDKTEGARRRTIIVPFPAHFRDNPRFEQETFTPDFLGGLLHLILEEATAMHQRGYTYAFSPATLGAKEEYDNEVNSAEAFLEHLRSNHVKAFTNYNLLRIAYEAWCSDHGYVPLGVTNLKRVMRNQALANAGQTFRHIDGSVKRWYFFDEAQYTDTTVTLDNGLHVQLPEDTPKQTPLPALAEEW